MDTERPKQNWYTRICVAIFLLFLGALVCWSFRFGSPQYQITTSILLSLSLMIVAILADSFTSISFGTIFNLKKEVVRVESEKREAKDEVRELRASLVNLATTVHQSQVTTNISGMDLDSLRQALGVVEATPEDKKSEEEDVKDVSEHEATEAAVTPRPTVDTWRLRRAIHEAVENELFRRFVEKYRVPPLELRREVRFDAGPENIDPIMNRNIIYDGYVRLDQKEYFIKASAPLVGPSIMRADRLYVALAKVLFYRQVKKVDAELVYLTATVPEDSGDSYSKRSQERLLEWFQPAIAGGLLRVETVTFSSDEYRVLEDDAKTKMTTQYASSTPGR